ncbi:hypothetical protein DFH06DRAFT_725796 [Mycena polygramma]|nr:hypothetical protein DFH06DRAFT_725796 [Mycena polygramma]
MFEVEKPRRYGSPLQHLFRPVFHWFRARSPHWQATSEESSSASPLHAQTEDSSAKFWSVYNSEAERYDSALVESWKADMEGMLIFSGLFSASLTAFIIESYKNLIPDPGNMTVALLSQLSEQLSAQFNGSHFAVTSPTPFQVPTTSLVCNGLWFVSLGLSLTCALLATLVEQWAREFLHKTEIRPSPVRRARVFSFLYYGISRFGIHAIVDIIPLLLHIGLVLFFAGLAVFLLPINSIMAGIVSGVLVVFVALYTVITILPVVSLDCPYRTPLSSIFWRFVQYSAMLLNLPSTGGGLTGAVLTAAMQRRDIRDERAVLWTLQSLTDNTELLPFVEATHEIIDGPTGLRRVDDHLFRLVLQTADAHTSFPRRIMSLLWSAETLPLHDPLRERRQMACLRALWALGIIAARITRAPANEVYGPDQRSLDLLTIPLPYRHSLNAVIAHVQLKSTFARFEDIRAMFALRDLSVPRERRRLVRSLRAIVPGLMTDISWTLRAPEVGSVVATLSQFALGDPDEPSIGDLRLAKHAVEQLDSTFSWAFNFSQIAVDLVRAAFQDGVVPYRFLTTCQEMLPNILAVPDCLLHVQSFLEEGPDALPQSLHSLLGEDAQSDLDLLMRAALRLLPLLDPTTVVPTVHWYLVHRAKGIHTQYAFAECSFETLADGILVDVRSRTVGFDTALGGILTLVLSSESFASLLDCEDVLSAIDGKPGWCAATAYPSLRALLSAKILAGLEPDLKPSGIWNKLKDGSVHLRSMQRIASHPLLDTQTVLTDEEVPTPDLIGRIADEYAQNFAGFLSACTAPGHVPYKAAATIRYLIRQWPPYLITSMSASAQVEFSQAVLKLIKSARDQDNPGRADIVRTLHEHLDLNGKFLEKFTDPQSVAVLAQALRIHGPGISGDGV